MDKVKETATLDQPNADLKTSSVWQSRRLNSKDTEKTIIRNATLVDSSNRELLRSGAAVETSIKEPVKLAGVERPPKAIPKTEVPSGISDEVRSEIIFSSGLIVRRDRSGSAAAWNGAVLNFKRFKKVSYDITNSGFFWDCKTVESILDLLWN